MAQQRHPHPPSTVLPTGADATAPLPHDLPEEPTQTFGLHARGPSSSVVETSLLEREESTGPDSSQLRSLSGEYGLPSGHMPYRIGTRIGAGGMGEVWRAEQVSLRRAVALKRVRADLIGGNDGLRAAAEFRAEALIGGRLDHPAIPAVHDFGIDENGRPYLSMKLVRGRPWDDVLRQDWSRMSVEDFLGKHLPILIQVTLGVAYAHSRGMIHRDLKTSQVMLGEFGETYLMDWGLALFVGEEDMCSLHEPDPQEVGIPTRREARNPAGTPACMAPEQTSRSAEGLGTWTDVYLLGGILYKMLSGKLPHDSKSSAASFVMAARGDVRPVREAAGERFVPDALAELCTRCLDADPARRVGSAPEFARALEEQLGGVGRHEAAKALVASVNMVLDSDPDLDYRALSELEGRASEARALMPNDEHVPELMDRLMERSVALALRLGDIGVAQGSASRIHSEERRRAAEARVSAEIARRRSQHRTRRLAVASFAVACVAIALLVLRSQALEDQQAAEERLRLQTESALRKVAETNARETVRLVEFVLQEMGRDLDFADPKQRLMRDRALEQIADRMLKLPEEAEGPSARHFHMEYLVRLSDEANALGRPDIARQFLETSLAEDQKDRFLNAELRFKALTRLAASLEALGEPERAAALRAEAVPYATETPSTDPAPTPVAPAP